MSKTKPIVAVKTGGGDSDRTVDALFRQTGVIPVNEVAQLFDVARVLDSQPLPPGDRVVVLSNAHGVRALAEGALVQAGLQMAELAADTRAHLAVDPAARRASVTNPVDLTFGAEPSDYDGALRCVLADDAVDVALVIYASAMPGAPAGHHRRDHRRERGPSDEAGGRERPRCRGPRPARRPRTQRAVVRVPGDCGRHPRPCRRARAWKRRPEGIVPDVDGLGVDLGRAEALVAHALDVRPTGTLLPWSVAAELLDIVRHHRRSGRRGHDRRGLGRGGEAARATRSR